MRDCDTAEMPIQQDLPPPRAACIRSMSHAPEFFKTPPLACLIHSAPSCNRWIACILFNSLYSFYWDVEQDWDMPWFWAQLRYYTLNGGLCVCQYQRLEVMLCI